MMVAKRRKIPTYLNILADIGEKFIISKWYDDSPKITIKPSYKIKHPKPVWETKGVIGLMNNLSCALQRLFQHEGKYSDHPSDRGGETYYGISRVNHPSWKGWQIIDYHKKETNFPEVLEEDKELQHKVNRFYDLIFWSPQKLNEIAKEDFEVAYEVFEVSVNMGKHWGGLFLQKALNVLNRGYRDRPLYSNLVEDGVVGPKTLNAVRAYLRSDDPKILLVFMNVAQGARYMRIMTSNEDQEVFARGWAKRVSLYKNND